MADDKGEPQRPEGLTCPLCLEAFKNPTLLRCGHTFCKMCLQNYDEQHNAQEHMECPVCRKRTKLDEKRVAGLSPNFSVLGLQDELHVAVDIDGRLLSNFCLLHRTEYRNIYCEVCEDLICLTCLIENHQGHKILKKEKIEEELRKREVALIEESKTRKIEAESYVKNAEQQRKDLHCQLSNLERAIREAFVRKVSVLRENQEKLVQKVQSLRKESDKQLDSCIGNEKQLIDKIESSDALFAHNTIKHLDADMLKLHRMQCVDLENKLRKTSDKESIAIQVQAAANVQFRPSDEKLLAIGHIELVGGKRISNNIQHSAAAVANQKADPKVKVSRIPTAVVNNAMTIVKTFDIPGIHGMAAQSEDAVVVGGSTRNGSDCLFVSGEKKTHLNSKEGIVFDIAFLTDGSAVVSHSKSACRLYDAHGVLDSGVQYRCKEGVKSLKLCSDQNDHIYAVNGNPEVYIFHGRNPILQRVIPTGSFRPTQVCVTKTGTMVISSYTNKSDTVGLFDSMGRLGTHLSTTESTRHMFATVDSQDRVLVARVRHMSPFLELTRYTLNRGTILVNERVFKSLKLPHVIENKRAWCYMASLTPNMLAFANGTHLHFINLAG